MLVVTLKPRGADGKQLEREFHAPFTAMPEFKNVEIDFIQADGHELDVIVSSFLAEANVGNETVGDAWLKFPTIPVPEKRLVVRWYGDLAKTIYFNLG